MNRIAVQMLVPITAKDFEIHFPKIFIHCFCYSLVVDESTYITSTAEICVFGHGLISDFEVFK
jgi:hypothetical protein